MPKFICSKCGKTVHDGDSSSGVCAACSAETAIAKPEHAEQAKVTPPSNDDGAFRAGLPPTPRDPKDLPWIYLLIMILLLPSVFGCLMVSWIFLYHFLLS